MNNFGRFISVIIAIFLISLGIVLLLENLGFVIVDPFELIARLWPLLLIAIGIYLIWLRFRPMPVPQVGRLEERIDGAGKADITINFGAGELIVYPLKESANLFEGEFTLETEKSIKRAGDLARIRLERVQWMFPPLGNWPRDDWRVGLTTKIPLDVHVNTGASRSFIDLTENKVDFIELNTGASDVTIKMPRESGLTRSIIKGGATDIKVEIPQGVAARIRSTGALGSFQVDETRFPKMDSVYVSPDYESSQNKIDIEVNTGVSSVSVV